MINFHFQPSKTTFNIFEILSECLIYVKMPRFEIYSHVLKKIVKTLKTDFFLNAIR